MCRVCRPANSIKALNNVFVIASVVAELLHENIRQVAHI